MTLARKHNAAIGMMLAAFTVVGAAAWLHMQAIERSFERIATVEWPASEAAYEMEINVVGAGLGVMKYLDTGEAAFLERVDKDDANFRRFHTQYSRLADSPRMKDLAERVGRIHGEYIALGRKLIGARDRQPVLQRQAMLDRFIELRTRLDTLLDDEIQTRSKQELLVTWNVAKRSVNRSLESLAALIAVALLVCAATGFLIKRQVIRPVEHLADVARQLGQGKLDSRAQVASHDELGQLATAINEMADLRLTAERELQLSQVELESRVAARTADLQIANSHLLQAKELAEAASQAKSSFLANMSHEVRTPLNGIMGTLDMLMKTGLAGTRLELARIAWSSSQSLLAIINDILDYSKLEVGKLSLVPARFDLSNVVEETVAPLRLSAGARKLEVVVNLASDVPRYVIADAGRLRQVITNLMHNAIKFTNHGRVTLSVADATQVADRLLVKFSVSDTGIGIPGEKLATIFARFEQIDRSITRCYGGTGLGLAISKQIVELMGGVIGVESRLHEGSTFWFTVPLTECPERRSESAVRVALPASERRQAGPDWLVTGEGMSAAPIRSGSARVLVTDDNAVNRRVAGLCLEQLGCIVDFASNGQEAVELLAKQAYDIVFMDLSMPEMDGLTATAEFRRRETGKRRTPIIAMTAYASEADKQSCLSAGMDDYLSKPVMANHFARMLEHWLPSGFKIAQPSACAASTPAAAEAAFESASEEAALDTDRWNALRGLAEKAGPDCLSQLVEEYVSDCRQRIVELADAARAEDADRVRKIAHALRGASANVGANGLVRISRQLEELGKTGTMGAAAKTIDQLEAEFDRVEAEFELVTSNRRPVVPPQLVAAASGTDAQGWPRAVRAASG